MSRAAWVSNSSPALVSVWPTGQVGRTAQLRERGYVSDSDKDTRGMPPAIAAHAIIRYSQPGSTVVDPDCGAGVVVAEALRAGRHAVGMTASPRWWRLARANVSAAKYGGAWHDGAILDAGTGGDPGLCRRADLILTTIRLPAVMENPGPDSDWMAGLKGWPSMLRPGGYAVIVLRSHRSPDGSLLDLAHVVSAAAEAGGLVPVDRCIALTGRLRADRVVARASVVERELADRARSNGMPIGLVAHRTVAIFRASDVADGVSAVPMGVAAAAGRAGFVQNAV